MSSTVRTVRVKIPNTAPVKCEERDPTPPWYLTYDEYMRLATVSRALFKEVEDAVRRGYLVTNWLPISIKCVGEYEAEYTEVLGLRINFALEQNSYETIYNTKVLLLNAYKVLGIDPRTRV